MKLKNWKYSCDFDNQTGLYNVYGVEGKTIHTFDTSKETAVNKFFEIKNNLLKESLKEIGRQIVSGLFPKVILKYEEGDIILEYMEKEEKEYYAIDPETDEPIYSSWCLPKEKCGDSDWYFDAETISFKQYYTYYDHTEGGNVKDYRELKAFEMMPKSFPTKAYELLLERGDVIPFAEEISHSALAMAKKEKPNQHAQSLAIETAKIAVKLTCEKLIHVEH